VTARGAAVAGALAVGCGGGGGGGGEPIALGAITPLTGDLVMSGHNQQEALLLAIDEINRAGGVLGRPLTLETRDDATTGPGTAAAFAELFDQGVPVILGPIHSAGVLASVDAIRGGRTLTISGGATSPALADIDDGGFFFRTVPSDAVQAIVLGPRIVSAGIDRLCIVHRNDAYGTGLSTVIKARLPESVMVLESPYDPTTLDAAAVMDVCAPALEGTKPGAVFVTFEGDGQAILEQAALQWDAARHGIFLVDGNRSANLFSALGARVAAFEGALGTAPSGPDPRSSAGPRLAAFLSRFNNKYRRPPSTNAENHYDAAYLAALAIELAGGADSTEAIRDAVGSTGAGSAIGAGDWAALRAAVATQGQVDYQGASGELNFDIASGELLPPYYVQLWTIRDGQITDLEVLTVTER